ncbi:GTP-binding protein, partial [Streptomyces sparsus]
PPPGGFPPPPASPPAPAPAQGPEYLDTPVAPVPVVPGRESGLGERLTALRELVGLSRTRLSPETLNEATRVLDEAAARGRLSRAHTTVAIAGATGSGKSTLFNALAGAQLSEAGVRRPTTAAPVACVWEATERSGGADGLLERLGVPSRSRRRAHLRDSQHLGLRGLVLLDLPDHDSTMTDHRAQVDRMLKLVDAVIWVVDPEKYADAALHENYLKPYAGHAEVTHVVLNQTDRLPGDAADEVVGDLRRLLDEDGMALGEHGEPGAQVLALSALTGEGVAELREALAELVAARV